MKKIHFDIEKAKLNGIWGLAVLTALLAACIGLSLTLLHNPHKDLHKKIFETADKVRNYYRDSPGYWRLSTDSAKENGLLADEFQQGYKEYDIQVGQGADGAMGMPSDMTFDITVKHLNKSACISLSEMSIEKDNQLALQKITVMKDNELLEFTWGGEHPLPIKKYDARDFCAQTENSIMWTFQ